MFTPETLAFLTELKANNTRDWFEANRSRCDALVTQPAKAFCAKLADRLSAASGAPVTAKLYRLHRDLRFSKDKTPYNTHVHMGFTGEGPGAWLVGLEPGSFVLGYGIMSLDGPLLDQWRQIVAGPEGAHLDSLLSDLQALSLRLDPPELKRVPAPYDPTHPRGALLKRKSLIVWNDSLPMETAFGPDAPTQIAAALSPFAALHTWLTTALR
jgi:TIGR02453 family protein